MAGLHAPLSTLRRGPHGQPRMTRGRCGSLLLHRKGLAPSTPYRSPGASHILPEKPEGNWPQFNEDQIRLYFKRIGNLVLLRASENSMLKVQGLM
jgi:Protein of unknown function (DUF1524)